MNIVIDNIINMKNNVINCDQEYFHGAMLIPKTKKIKSYIIGVNSNRCPHNNKHITTHAEIDVLLKTKRLIKIKKIKDNTFDLIII